jgi:hypothetical protein
LRWLLKHIINVLCISADSECASVDSEMAPQPTGIAENGLGNGAGSVP